MSVMKRRLHDLLCSGKLQVRVLPNEVFGLITARPASSTSTCPGIPPGWSSAMAASSASARSMTPCRSTTCAIMTRSKISSTSCCPTGCKTSTPSSGRSPTCWDFWVKVALGQKGEAQKIIDNLPRQHPFEVRNARVEPVDWENCSQVLDAAEKRRVLSACWS